MRLVFLDTGPLGLISHPRAKPDAVCCRQGAQGRMAAGVRLVVPETCDFEVRRELIRANKTAELWAQARNRRLTPAPADALDGACILAAQALHFTGPGDAATVATDNVGHLAQLVDARPRTTITR